VLDKAGEPRSVMKKGMTFSSSSLALGGALEGAGVALTDSRLVERELKYAQLVIPFELACETPNAFYLVYPKGRQLNRGMQAFRDWVFAEMEVDAASAGPSAQAAKSGQ